MADQETDELAKYLDPSLPRAERRRRAKALAKSSLRSDRPRPISLYRPSLPRPNKYVPHIGAKERGRYA